jgi:broad specificity phosphatase PhoE
MIKFKNNLTKNILFICVVIVTFSSIIYIYDVREKIIDVFSGKSIVSNYNEIEKQQLYLDVKYANLILKGNYILFFRHAHREKWIDVQSYDAEEVLQKKRGENNYFNRAVCLSEMGKIQAQMMGEQFKRFNLPIARVISSPSCRSRQTAQLTFGGIDQINNVFMHYGPFNETKEEHAKLVKEELKLIDIIPNSNVIISAHGNTIRKDVFDKIEADIKDYSLEEGGFFVITKKNNKMILLHKFFNYGSFTQALYLRPLD